MLAECLAKIAVDSCCNLTRGARIDLPDKPDPLVLRQGLRLSAKREVPYVCCPNMALARDFTPGREVD
jgi:hypothetical protein